jgi:hypothetical protein
LICSHQEQDHTFQFVFRFQGLHDSGHVHAALYSFVAAESHKFLFNYSALVELLRERSEQFYDDVRLSLSPLRFLELLEFRLHEIDRVAAGGEPEWQWPPDWPGDPGWNGPVRSCVTERPSSGSIQEARQETERAIRLHMELMGHGRPLPPRSGGESPLEWLVGDLVAAGFKAPSSGPRSFVSLERTSRASHPRNQDGVNWDIDGILGSYSTGCHEIAIYERAIAECAEELSIAKRALMRIVEAHEYGHFLLHAAADSSHPGGWTREAFSEPDAPFHEAVAQLAAYRYKGPDFTSEEAYESLLRNQSPVYHSHQKLLARTTDVDRLWRALLIAVSEASPPRLDAWLRAL